MRRQALAGRHVVVTRPEAQADSLCAAITAQGGMPVRFPVLAIGPAADRSELERCIGGLDAYDLAFFVSPNAVRYALDAVLARRGWPPRLKVATVGRGSERALNAFGFCEVIAPQDGFDSEAVLALPSFRAEAVAGRRVLIFRGDGGRDLLGETLRERGAAVDYVTCYRRYRPDLNPSPLLELARDGRLDAITLTSSEGVDNLVAMLGTEGMTRLGAIPLFASHPRIAERARAAGFTRVIETPAGDDGLLAALASHF